AIGTTWAGERRARAAEKPSTASAETTAAAIITKARDERWRVEGRRVSRPARPAPCCAISAPGASMAATTALRWPDVVAGSMPGGRLYYAMSRTASSALAAPLLLTLAFAAEARRPGGVPQPGRLRG